MVGIEVDSLGKDGWFWSLVFVFLVSPRVVFGFDKCLLSDDSMNSFFWSIEKRWQKTKKQEQLVHAIDQKACGEMPIYIHFE